MIERCLIIDTETNSLDHEKGERIEVAACLFSLSQATTLAQFSTILPASNVPDEIERITRIPRGAMREMGELVLAHDAMLSWVTSAIEVLVTAADVIVAHNAEFDVKWWHGSIRKRPWVCTLTDFEWPRATRERSSLVHLAIDHDVPIGSVHRALGDCTLLAGILSRYTPDELQRMFARAMRPKGWFMAVGDHSVDFPFPRKDEAKSRGFAWNAEGAPPKSWSRWMAIEDTALLPFRTMRLDVPYEQRFEHIHAPVAASQD